VLNRQARNGQTRPRASAAARPAVVAAASALAARGAYAGLRRWPPAGESTWTRTNHRGEHVTLLEGPAVAVGTVTAQVIGAAVVPRVTAHGIAGSLPVTAGPGGEPATFQADLGIAVAGLGALGFGVLDDLRGSGKRRGLRGHLGALAHGEVTTGTVKLAGLAATGLGAALLQEACREQAAGAGTAGRAGNVIVNAGLIAGGANLLNLFDLRPGRAIKVAALAAGLIAVGGTVGTAGGRQRLAGLTAVAAPAGAALALLPEDLRERAMLGDAGANALGAALGAAAARALPWRARLGLLGAIAALTLASEKVSFTRVIEATPPLHWLDMLGRRPPQAPADREAGADGLTPAQIRRHRAGRHRRDATGVSRHRSAVTWFSDLFKTPARREP
jgi:UDP-GlcNAc:undecaprenyl-phosphate/decaprenyl-phosphate GlcNAc-1-phosphate transferase